MSGTDLLYGLAISGAIALLTAWVMHRRNQPGWLIYAVLTFFVLPVGLIAAIVAIAVHPKAHAAQG